MARPPFINGFEYRGPHAYSVTCCAHERKACLTEASDVALVIGELNASAVERHFEVLAYCVMPDHVHVLVQGTSADAEFRPFMKVWRQRTATAYSRTRGHRLWQVGYWERTVRSSEDLQAVANYIVANPVRAGLTASVDAWPYAGGSLVKREDTV